MTAAVARQPTADDHPLLAGYIDHIAVLAGSDRTLRDRLRIARQFLDDHHDLQAWMDSPLDGRLAALKRIKAWPLICYAILAGHVRVDLDLLMAKDLGHLSRTTRPSTPSTTGDCAPPPPAWAGHRCGPTPSCAAVSR